MSNNKQFQINASQKTDAGFSLLEAVIAIAILTIGLVGTAAAVTYALQFSAISENVTKSKLLLMASVEQIESLRNSRRLEYKQIANTGAVNNNGTEFNFSGFSTGFQPISDNPGADGVFGTADDVSSTANAQYSRQIVITELSASIKKIQVTVRYPGKGGTTGQITGTSYLNDDARMNR